jgi:glycosyltransferase involved in cell wall biosynthesis
MRDNLANRCRVSLKLLEYLSMELPVIGHVVGHSRDVFGPYCFMCDPEPGALTQTILDVMKSASRKASARPFIVENYDWEKLMPSLEIVLDYCEVSRS